jgi:fructokinase
VTSRASIRKFLRAAQKKAVRVFDVNLRQSFFSKEILTESMKVAEIVKLNHDELPSVMQLLGLEHRDEIASANSLMELHHLKLICVTRGGRGSLLISQRGSDEHPGYLVQVADAIGAGDAFTAGLVHEYMRGSPLPEMNETANRVGAWVASQVGAMPSPGRGGIRGEMARITKDTDFSG